jgi:cytochrome P450
MWAFSSYDNVRWALGHHQHFTSEQGVAMSDEVNTMFTGIGPVILHDDGDAHTKLRSVLADLLGPRAVRKLTEDIQREADALVAGVVKQKDIDGIQDLAAVLPVSVIARLVGLPEEKRMNLLDWADAAFTVFGPMNERTIAGLPKVQELWDYLTVEAARENLSAESWGALIYEAGDRGDIPVEACFSLMYAFAGAGMDTTISAIGSALYLLGRNPDQWQQLRAEPSLIPSAFNEVLRLESPVQGFSRVALRDIAVGDVVVPEGSRVVMLYGSANRDGSKWSNPDRLDIRRNPTDHLGFGYGLHSCVGQALARIEAHAVLKALTDQVSSFTIGDFSWSLNNTSRRLKSLSMSITAS